jgi:transcriptional regulator with XRE-family HTH domain
MSADGVTTSAAYLSQLRTGKRDNPSARHLAALAAIFEVPLDYFFDDRLRTRIDDDLRLLVAIRESGVRAIAMRLSSVSLATITELIDRVRDLERLPEVEES